MLHLFDANVLITASNTYYPIDQIPEFWDWIDHQAANDRIKLPVEILEEVLAGSKKEDPLLAWMTDHKDVLRLKETVDPTLVNKVVTEGYAPDLTDDELEEIGRDPFLIAYALAQPNDRCVVTVEVSAPGKQRQNRRVPDVCNTFGVKCQNPFQVYRSLGFSTSWKG
ncbi:MAG TPA: DUF4411 family protein [Bryobacteraceae bacterium]|nr:DUF4411 family protein [Bryobacteraceae bacterium]